MRKIVIEPVEDVLGFEVPEGPKGTRTDVVAELLDLCFNKEEWPFEDVGGVVSTVREDVSLD